MLEGEFGRDVPALSIEAIGARYDAKGAGVGRRLLDALADDARRRGIGELRTQARWNNHAMLRWLDENGFEIAANHIVDCAVAGGAYDASRDDAVPVAAREATWRRHYPRAMSEGALGRVSTPFEDGDFDREVALERGIR